MSSNSNTIDLTDEDDARPHRGNAQNGPPSLVALNVRRPQQIVQTQQQQQPSQQRQLLTAQQTIRNAAALAVTQTRKLPVIGE